MSFVSVLSLIEFFRMEISIKVHGMKEGSMVEDAILKLLVIAMKANTKKTRST
jgi:hypothetical protein